jgi:hypothetical protein
MIRLKPNGLVMKKINVYRILWPIFIFLFSLGQLQRVQVSQNIAFYLHDPLILIWVGIFIWKDFDLKNLKTKLKNNLWLSLFGIWSFLILVLSQIFSQNFDLKPYLYFGRTLNYLLFGLSLTQLKEQLTVKINHKKLSLLKIGLIFISIFIVASGFLQYLLMPDGRHLARYGWDEHYYRLMGLYLDPNFTGLLIVFSLINLLNIEITNPFKKDRSMTVYLAISFIIAIIALLLTYSRSCYLVFLGAASLLALDKLKQKKKSQTIILVLTIISFISSLPFLPNPGGAGVNLKRTDTIKSRVDANAGVINRMNSLQWIVGQGLFTNRIIYQTDQAHAIHAHFPDSIIIFIVSGSGLIGLSLLSLGLVQLTRRLKKNWLKLILLAAFLIHNLFNLSLIEPFSLLLLLTGLAV